MSNNNEPKDTGAPDDVPVKPPKIFDFAEWPFEMPDVFKVSFSSLCSLLSYPSREKNSLTIITTIWRLRRV